jgi:hypothetical protein
MDIRPCGQGKATVWRTPADEVGMIVMLSIAGFWLLGSLLVLALCAAAADGDRALAEQLVA